MLRVPLDVTLLPGRYWLLLPMLRTMFVPDAVALLPGR